VAAPVQQERAQQGLVATKEEPAPRPQAVGMLSVVARRAGAVGGVAPSGAVGGGTPTNSAATKAAAPQAASLSVASPNTATPTSPNANPPTSGGVMGGYTGTQPADAKVSPPITAQSSPPIVPDGVQGFAAEQPGSRTGLAKPADDGVSTKIIPARPCITAAKETDGTTTCVGIPDKR
jgi:hypothetical protein